MMFGSRKSGSKSPRFFCESCGVEVPRDAKNCPKCGRFFASVRCPACGFIGEEAIFKGGCPVCDYSSVKNPGKLRDFPERKSPAGPLPFWVYILVVAVFTGVLAALLFRIF
jgi:hypothetical protein